MDWYLGHALVIVLICAALMVASFAAVGVLEEAHRAVLTWIRRGLWVLALCSAMAVSMTSALWAGNFAYSLYGSEVMFFLAGVVSFVLAWAVCFELMVITNNFMDRGLFQH